MSLSKSNDQEPIQTMVEDLNKEIAYSLSTLSQLNQSTEHLNMAYQLVQVKTADINAISSLAQIIMNQHKELTDQDIATLILKELSNSHPNRLIKTVCKRMIRQKWGVK